MARVLIVDDYPDAREILALFLGAHGFDTSEAADGEEAVRKARAERPDVILMDLAMPGIDGVEATAILRDDPRTTAIPVIALTGHGELVDPNGACAMCDTVLLKPAAPEQVAREIRRVLGQRTRR